MIALSLLLSVKILTPDLDAYIEKARADWQVPGLAVVIVRGDEVVTKGYGVRRLGAPERVDRRHAAVTERGAAARRRRASRRDGGAPHDAAALLTTRR